MASRRAVITGAGPISGLGIGMQSVRAGLQEGQAMRGEITLFDPTPYDRECAVEVGDFNLDDYVTSQQAYLDRAAELTFAAMHLAVEDAGLEMSSLAAHSTGLVVGSAWGCQDTASLFFADVLEKGPRFAKPFLFPHTYANTVISLVAMEYGLTGFHMHFASGAAAGAQAIAKAYDLVRSGRQDLVFAGGFDALSETRMAAHALRGLLAGGGREEEGCVPFGGGDGTVLGEGAAVLVIEDLERARDRGATILAEITGCGISGSVSGAMRAVGAGQAGSCVLAAANGCGEKDAAEMSELMAIEEVASGTVPVTALKPFFGETDGAAACLHAAGALAMLREGFIPPIPGLAKGKNSIDIVTDACRRGALERVLVNAVDGGNAVCLAIDKAD